MHEQEVESGAEHGAEHEGKQEKKDEGMNDLINGALAGKIMSGDGVGKAGWGLAGLILGGLLNNNGGGLFGGGTSNSDRFANTDQLILGSSNQVQMQAAQDTAAIQASICALASKVEMGTAASIQATEKSTGTILSAMDKQAIDALQQENLFLKLRTPAVPPLV